MTFNIVARFHKKVKRFYKVFYPIFINIIKSIFNTYYFLKCITVYL